MGKSMSPPHFTPVFVHPRRRRERDKWRSSLFMCAFFISCKNVPKFRVILLILLSFLCSLTFVESESVSEPSFSNGNAFYDGSSGSAYPKFDIKDLVNLIEIFPEFREYVYKVLATHVQQQNSRIVSTTTPRAIYENTDQFKNNFNLLNQFNALNSQWNNVKSESTTNALELNSRKDYLPYNSVPGAQPASPKHGYDHHQHHSSSGYDYYGHHKPKPFLHNNYGWNTEYKDPNFNYEVGYNLGKDLSCLFGLLGFKGFKELTFFSFFSILKKIKYIFLVVLAFKLGVILSPIALPLLLPIILLSVIAKVLPLLLIIVLLFKLLKTQVKFKGGRTEDGSLSSISFLDGTQISRLWKSVEEATENVVGSEKCVEKIICKINVKERSISKQMYGQERGVVSEFWLYISDFSTQLTQKALSWINPSIQWEAESILQNETSPDEGEKVIECEKIACKDPKVDNDVTTLRAAI
ncbi:unnamed protein product [Orchesella dallaii]|uniref:Uncharacterized protein n=1 Tax=Orchesella dallaii TaxID=48710 RepID=A0ABP1PQT5_9HEXA